MSARVAFLAHFLEPGDLALWDPTLAPIGAAACERFLDRTQGLLDPFDVGELTVRSASGREVAATIIGLSFTPAQVMAALRSGQSAWALDLVKQGVEVARARGATVVGFGGYTSIVSDSCRLIVEDRLALTSGNALTASSALDALALAADRLALSPRRLGVVGAAGNIGAVLAAAAADQVDELLLVGRKGAAARLQKVADEIGGKARVATDLAALRDCNLILSATNAPRPVILPEHVAEGPVVLCDVAQPRDVDPSLPRARPEAVVLKGGLIRLPLGQRAEIPGLRLDAGQVFGCLAETLLLGLADRRSHFAYGRLTLEEIRLVRALAHQHGFAVEEHRVDGT